MIPFQNCRIIGDGVDHDAYAKQPEGIKRGDVDWIMSRGELMTFAECPAKWIKGAESESTKSTDYGDLIDSLLLSPAKAEMKFAVPPAEYEAGKPWNWNATKCRTWREEKESDGLVVVSEKDMKKATTALQSLQSNKDIMELVECSRTQVMATGDYVDEATGLTVPLKILLDLVPDKAHPRWGKSLADFKTAATAEMFLFGRAINQHHYDAQAGLYLPIYAAATGEDRVDWRLAVQESSEPYHSEIYTLSGDFSEGSQSSGFANNGVLKINRALKFYCACLKHNYWPGYSAMARTQYSGIGIVSPEDWMITRLADFCRIPEMQLEQTKSETLDVLP